jgi:hypothetical protein
MPASIMAPITLASPLAGPSVATIFVRWPLIAPAA